MPPCVRLLVERMSKGEEVYAQVTDEDQVTRMVENPEKSSAGDHRREMTSARLDTRTVSIVDHTWLKKLTASRRTAKRLKGPAPAPHGLRSASANSKLASACRGNTAQEPETRVRILSARSQ